MHSTLDTRCSQKAALGQVFRINSVYVTYARVIHQNMSTTRKHMQSGAHTHTSQM